MDQTPSPFAGMTVNERLFVAGLLDAWDKAELQRDLPQLIDLLKRVDMTDEQAIETAEYVLTFPNRLKD